MPPMNPRTGLALTSVSQLMIRKREAPLERTTPRDTIQARVVHHEEV